MTAEPQAPAKPSYRVPGMAEIRAIPWNGYRAASTFSGCGGSSLGYRMAGYRVVYANEFVEAARETYAANAAPYTIIDGRDIRAVTADSFLDMTGLAVGELDLLDGSPPCASFSTAGKRQEKWGKVSAYSDTKQRSDDLFFEFARLLGGVQPRVFVAENVSGLVKGSAKGYFKEILAALRAAGYVVAARLLDAQWLGVPQARQRLIFVGVRSDLAAAGLAPAHPSPLPYRYTVREALPHVIEVGTAPPHSDYVATGRDVTTTLRPADSLALPTVMAAGVNKGAGMVRVVHDTSGTFSIGDVTDRPVPTITAGASSGGDAQHYRVLGEPAPAAVDPETGASLRIRSTKRDVPEDCRKLTLGELRALCGFPPDFTLTGTYTQRWERLGRAVPPVMMAHIAATVRDRILARAEGPSCAG
jgi:DNA (cytosine-5)-methyltransferase 1